ncbi:MAG: hypothetical protein LIO90_10195 [Bacteroidales bacterium]|nr:hypothetical protein [Bacteroidales bacterium]
MERLIFDRPQLLYSIANLAHIQAEQLEEDPRRQRLVTDLLEDGNHDRVDFTIWMALDDCVETLYPLTASLPRFRSITDRRTTPARYVIELLWSPVSPSKTTLRMLHTIIHEYIVVTVLADWMRVRAEELAPAWDNRRTALMQRLRSIKTRLSPTRRRLDIL